MRPVILVLALALGSACSGKRGSTITVDGSSTVYPITEAVAESFGAASPDTRVTVGISGTGGGFRRFCHGETDLQDASRPIKASEAEACAKAGVDFIEVPVAYDGIVVVVNPKNTWATSITLAELKTIWSPEAQGKIMRWNQVRPDWPDRPLRLFGAGVDSGTFDYLTEAVVGKAQSSRSDFTSSEDDNVLVQGVAGDENALGFFGFAYYDSNKTRVTALAVDGGQGPVAPSLDAIRTNSYRPLSRPLFVYVSKKALERPEVQTFTTFYMTEGPKLVAEVGYIPLPDNAYVLGRARVDQRTTGSLFLGADHGSQIGLSIEQILAREQAN
ncbi:MAG: PstS family phosphate ABC transporter substrate-binding protein [Deltaproteobacteria bacterium]|nr:PstS family phosphate ABC transporter substrate-binding protein [Deltaproteobacteria bacterium]